MSKPGIYYLFTYKYHSNILNSGENLYVSQVMGHYKILKIILMELGVWVRVCQIEFVWRSILSAYQCGIQQNGHEVSFLAILETRPFESNMTWPIFFFYISHKKRNYDLVREKVNWSNVSLPSGGLSSQMKLAISGFLVENLSPRLQRAWSVFKGKKY